MERRYDYDILELTLLIVVVMTGGILLASLPDTSTKTKYVRAAYNDNLDEGRVIAWFDRVNLDDVVLDSVVIVNLCPYEKSDKRNVVRIDESLFKKIQDEKRSSLLVSLTSKDFTLFSIPYRFEYCSADIFLFLHGQKNGERKALELKIAGGDFEDNFFMVDEPWTLNLKDGQVVNHFFWEEYPNPQPHKAIAIVDENGSYVLKQAEDGAIEIKMGVDQVFRFSETAIYFYTRADVGDTKMFNSKEELAKGLVSVRPYSSADEILDLLK